MLKRLTDVTQLDGLVRYSRGVALSRLALVACFVLLLITFTPWRIAGLGVLEFGLYFALFLATELALRDPDPERAHRRLALQSDVLMLLLVTNACWLAVQIRLYEGPQPQVEAALLAICVLLFAALRVHLTRVSYVIGVVPPSLTLIWIAIDWSDPFRLTHYTLAMALFVAAVLVVTARQQATDRALTKAMRDLTRNHVALTQAMHESRAANRAKSELLAVASHEIRTPLNAILGFARALRGEPLTPRQADLAESVVESGEQLTRLLNGVLDQARADPLRAKLDVAPLDLRALARSVVRVWSGHARAIGVSLTLEDADPTLSFLVVADLVRVEQTLVNLVSNALGAVSAGGRVTLRLAGVVEGESLRVLVEVADTGPPIPPEDRARMFEAWDQTERGRIQGGTGVVLRVCAQNLALMGGEIAVDPPNATLAAGQGGRGGAVFWFAFAAPIHRPRPAPVPIDRTGREEIRVLAAEDNGANRKVLALALENAPVALTFAEDGALALDLWRAGIFDLILMDVNMPVLGGREAVREIRRTEPAGTRIPIWMLTANVFPEDVALYREDGADGVLRKPLDVAALYALLAEIAQKRMADA
ncbi:response regulator [Caulobacter segnis]|jgi:signal transduction histidine kinase/CheY-like chemotaxis protein|uniref:response regulator n=1 Tax=Caulobacter segnis TaxID=88688 RepID=UPI001CBD41DC|nr:response regulator [Caulobacter segnis]UAL11766.1 response regulator [Caulobacter segnis]